jgi:hypothetical protein
MALSCAPVTAAAQVNVGSGPGHGFFVSLRASFPAFRPDLLFDRMMPGRKRTMLSVEKSLGQYF